MISEGHPFDRLRAGSQTPGNPESSGLHTPFFRSLLVPSPQPLAPNPQTKSPAHKGRDVNETSRGTTLIAPTGRGHSSAITVLTVRPYLTPTALATGPAGSSRMLRGEFADL